MKVLFIGDIFGSPGREVVKKILPDLIERLQPNVVIANPENLAHGAGFSSENIREMQKAGVDFFTSGNHVWDNKDGARHLGEKDFPVLRPANYPQGVAGRGYEIIKDDRGKKILVISLIGRVFMKKDFDCPFRKADEILEKTKKEKLSAIFIDFHAETTAEKYALAYYLDGRVSAVIGTHTHVPTADFQVLEKGTAYMSDAGMTGCIDSIIGVKKDIIIHSFLTQLPVKHEPETHGRKVLSGVFIDIDDKSKKALNIEHVFEFLQS